MLESCKHIVPDIKMKRFIVASSEKGNIARCPVCKKPIVNSIRYKKQVRDHFTNLTSLKLEKKKQITDFVKSIERNAYSLVKTLKYNDIGK